MSAIGPRTANDLTPAELTTAAFYHKSAIDYGVAYRVRLKMAGEDSTKEEFQLRALEHTINFYLSNNPGVDIDTANAAVRAAINGEAT